MRRSSPAIWIAAMTAMRSLPTTLAEPLMASMRWSTRRTAASRASFSAGRQASEYSRPRMETSTRSMTLLRCAGPAHEHGIDLQLSLACSRSQTRGIGLARGVLSAQRLVFSLAAFDLALKRNANAVGFGAQDINPCLMIGSAFRKRAEFGFLT